MTDIERGDWVQLDGLIPTPIAEAIFDMLREVGGWQQDRTGPEPVLTLTHHQLPGAYLEWDYRTAASLSHD